MGPAARTAIGCGVIWCLWLGWMACADPPPVVEAEGSDGPWRAVLAWDAAQDRFRATLHNDSGRPQPLLHDPELQPSRLVLRRQGREVEATDRRAAKKFDPTVRPGHLQMVGPGQSVSLGSAVVEPTAEGGAVTWGPYQHVGLSKGAYEVRLVVTSAPDDELGSVAGRLPDRWTGELTTEPITVELE